MIIRHDFDIIVSNNETKTDITVDKDNVKCVPYAIKVQMYIQISGNLNSTYLSYFHMKNARASSKKLNIYRCPDILNPF